MNCRGVVHESFRRLVFEYVRSMGQSLGSLRRSPVGPTPACGLAGLLLLVVTVPSLIFYGASMLLAAARGYAGCEILAIHNWVTRRDDRMACPVFSPIAAAEATQRRISNSAS